MYSVATMTSPQEVTTSAKSDIDQRSSFFQHTIIRTFFRLRDCVSQPLGNPWPPHFKGLLVRADLPDYGLLSDNRWCVETMGR